MCMCFWNFNFKNKEWTKKKGVSPGFLVIQAVSEHQTESVAQILPEVYQTFQEKSLFVRKFVDTVACLQRARVSVCKRKKVSIPA